MNTDLEPLQSQFFRVPQYLLNDPDKYLQFEKSLDRYLRLSEEQEEILSIKEKAFLVQGPAGTGKTTLALFSALNTYEDNTDDAIYLFTYHEELACVCRAYKVNLLGSDEFDESKTESGIKVFSYIEFCRQHLRKSLKKKDKDFDWINKSESIDLLRQILNQKPRWSRHFIAEELYGLIYSILKGRFMPGTESLPATKEDYERIFKDYGRMPEALDETLEIFSQYQSRLDKSKFLDEADLIRLSYDSLKRKALLADADRRLWIIIDEVQDFTELEWKSILLFWENHCEQLKSSPSYPFLSGDTNQNISRSGFRWQELESYLHSILKKLHRPNSLKKVQLHQNYRNTLQIHKLAAFVRKFGSDTIDLGLPPEFEGKRPRMIVANDQDIIDFLKTKDETNDTNNPVVVLVENENSLSLLRRELSSSKSIFLLLLRNSKGMEFEDVIIHRAFSSSLTASSGYDSSRLFDLWYMGITRARKNLLLVQTEDDKIAFQKFLEDRADELCLFDDLLEQKEKSEGLAEFWNDRELLTPNYNVIFLERKLAQDLFEEFCKEINSLSDNETLSTYAEECRERALQLWTRCLDFASLGKALMKLERYVEAVIYLQRAGLVIESAYCLERSQQYKEAADEYETLELFEDAARCCQHNQDFLKAGELYEKDNCWLLAAQSYAKGGNVAKAAAAYEEAGIYRTSAELFQSKGDYQKSAELFVKVEDFISAAENYLSINSKLDAARCFEKAGKYDEAIELYEAMSLWGEAAKAAKAGGLHAKAGKLFLKAGDLPESADSYEAANLSGKAGDLYAKIKDFSQAAHSYQNAGNLDEAALMYEQSGDWEKALELAELANNKALIARCHDKLGDFKRAAELFIECKAYSEAAYCLEKANDFAAASDLHLKCQNFAQAASCLAKIDRRMDAAKLYVVSGQIALAFELVSTKSKVKAKDESNFKQLLDWSIESKKLPAAAQLLEFRKDYRGAADKFKECMMFPKAAECLEKSKQFTEAGQLYKESKQLQKAADCFKQAQEWQNAGECFEQMQNWADAKSMYELCNCEVGIARCKNALNWL